MSRHQIDYETLAQDAMRGLVRTVLQRVARSGLPGDHHFYISFHTRGAGVTVSKRLLERYPDEMTIVLQNKFSDLKAFEDRFEVTLWFDSIPERLAIPFTAIKVFFDPSVPFGHQFEVSEVHSGSGPHAVGPHPHGERAVDGREVAPGPASERRHDERPLPLTSVTTSPAPRSRPAGKGEASKPAGKGPAPVTPVAAPSSIPAEPASTIGKAQPAKAPPRPADTTVRKTPSDETAGTGGKAAPAPASPPEESQDVTEGQPPSKVVALDAFRKKS